MQNILGSPATTSMSPLDSLGSSSNLQEQFASANPLKSNNFLANLQAISPFDPMQMSASVDQSSSPVSSAAQLVGNQLLNALQQQQQQPQQQGNFLPSLIQDVMQQQHRSQMNRRMGENSQQEENFSHGINNDQEMMMINNNGLLASTSTNELGNGDSKPVIREMQKPINNGPLTLLKQLLLLPPKSLTEQPASQVASARSLTSNSLHSLPNWINGNNKLSSSSSLNGAQKEATEPTTASSSKSVLSKSGQFLQNLFMQNVASFQKPHSNHDATKRYDDTKLISLNDKHRYSLVLDGDKDEMDVEKKKIAPPTTTSLVQKSLSAVSHIIGLNSISTSTNPRNGSGSLAQTTLPSTDHHQHSNESPLKPHAEAQTQTQTQTNGQLQQEQRDLTQIVPQSWKDAVKRTYQNVQHSATNQWRSLEGQLTSWIKPIQGQSTAATSYHLTGSGPVNSNAHNHFHTASNGLAISNLNQLADFSQVLVRLQLACLD